MRYAIEYERDAFKALRAIRDKRIAAPLKAAIEALADDPRPPGCRKLTGRKDEWRIRVGDWRVIYRVEDGRLVVVVVAVGVRGGVYG
jgi:mRNA interferase RelE/StbE